jgi:lipopolysaccharide export system protein LptA
MISMAKYLGPINFSRRVAHAASAMLFALTIGAAYETAAQSSVQGVPNAMQGFSQNRDDPIQVGAASLEMREERGELLRQCEGGARRHDHDVGKLVVFYESSSAPGAPQLTNTKGAAKTAPLQSVSPGPGGSSSIKRLEARGDVRVTQKDQVVTGETAVFDTKTNLITMLGGVVLTQCKSVLRGDRLLVDMTRAFRGSNPIVEKGPVPVRPVFGVGARCTGASAADE